MAVKTVFAAAAALAVAIAMLLPVPGDHQARTSSIQTIELGRG
jgi:hypothetical protein